MPSQANARAPRGLAPVGKIAPLQRLRSEQQAARKTIVIVPIVETKPDAHLYLFDRRQGHSGEDSSLHLLAACDHSGWRRRRDEDQLVIDTIDPRRIGACREDCDLTECAGPLSYDPKPLDGHELQPGE